MLKPALPVRVLLVDDQPMFVEALKALLESDDRVDVVAATDNGAHAIELAATSRADVAIVDLNLPGLDGVETTRLLVERTPELRVVVVSGRSEGTEEQAALDAGAACFLYKGGLHDEIANAIVAAHLAA